MALIKFNKVTSLPANLEPDVFYFVFDENISSYITGYITDKNGVARQLAGAGGSGSSVNGGVFVTDVTPLNPLETIDNKVWANNNENNQLVGFRTTTINKLYSLEVGLYITQFAVSSPQ